MGSLHLVPLRHLTHHCGVSSTTSMKLLRRKLRKGREEMKSHRRKKATQKSKLHNRLLRNVKEEYLKHAVKKISEDAAPVLAKSKELHCLKAIFCQDCFVYILPLISEKFY
ncbi:unnamed protein product [Amaranthus hypochondriacus]